MKPLKIKSKKAKKTNKRLGCSERQEYIYCYVGSGDKIYCPAFPKDTSTRHSTKIVLICTKIFSSCRAVNTSLLVYNMTVSVHTVT